MRRDYWGALRLLLILLLGGGGYGLALVVHEFHGWASILLRSVSVAGQVYAMMLLIEEGRARERAEREREERATGRRP
jgi:hypothetical protein